MDEVIAHIKQYPSRSFGSIPVTKLFLAKYGQFPRKLRLKPISKDTSTRTVFHVKTVLDRIHGNDKVTNELSIAHRRFHPCSKTYFSQEQLLPLPNIHGVLLYFEECKWKTNYINHARNSIQPDYAPDHHFLTIDYIDIFYTDENEAFVEKLANNLVYDDTFSLQEFKVATLRLIGRCKNRCSGDYTSFNLLGCTYIKKPCIDDLALSYGGQHFLQVHNKIVSWLNKTSANGLVLLHGAPGSGKTHYIRYLLHRITNEKDKHLIYVPSDMINELTGSKLIPLLLKYPNSLLIIEDAEGSLSRSGTSDQSVANLLNLSDGLLSDGVQVQIIATFNCPLISLDPALLRPGRLIVQYCFPSTLTIENAKHLASLINVSKIDQINEPMSLASVYALRDENLVEEQCDEIISSCNNCLKGRYYYEEEE